jgi:hypothetical protein
LLADKEQEAVWGYLEERFGIPSDLRRNYTLWKRGGTYWALSASSPSVGQMPSLKVVAVGIPLARRIGRRLKPTTGGLKLLSRWVLFNRVCIQKSVLYELLRKGEAAYTASSNVSDGYVLLETEEGVLGCGLLDRGKLLFQIPKADVMAFLPPITESSSSDL